MIKISVIVPTYKPKDYIIDCITSLAYQSLDEEEYEVLIVLNGEKETYDVFLKKIIESLHKKNLKLLYSEKPNVSNARNIGIQMSKGEYIAFVDDDDFVSPSYLEELYEHAKPDIVSLCYPLSFIDGSDDYKPYYITRDYIQNVENSPCSYKKARRFFSGPVYKLIHKDVIGDRRFDVTFKNGEDSIFMFEISDALKNVDFTSKNAVYYRRIRNGSALLRKKSSFELWDNCIRMFTAYTRILMRRPFKYSFSFYFTRLLGAIHGVIEQYQLRREKTL